VDNDPAAILARPELRAVIDTGQPAGAVARMIMHYFSLEEARRICAQLSEMLAPGSYLVISALTAVPFGGSAPGACAGCLHAGGRPLS
jgi:hypothetical protein